MIKSSEMFESQKLKLESLFPDPKHIFRGASFHNPETYETESLVYLRDTFPAYGFPNVVLLGDTGAGKSYAGVCYMVQHGQYSEPWKKFCGRYVKAYDLWRMADTKDTKAQREMEDTPILMIDDLGTEPGGFKGSDFGAYFEFLYIQRYERRKPTIVTTNATLKEFMDVYGARIEDRARDHGKIFQTAEASRRAKA